jgi:pimeloyl-ACP methyl ester carboxylesterase
MRPFRVEVPAADLADLRDRLRRTRWPDAETVDDWSQGVPLSYLQELCAYWAEEHDWRVAEARLNAVPQFRTTIDGLGIHLLHARSPHPGALPLLLTSGWPGSVLEFGKLLAPLTDPLDARDAFHVVCPSLPGYGFSDRPGAPGWGFPRIARAWAELMARLGYDRYGAAGSDWGTSVTASLGQQDPGHLVGIHLVPPLAAPDPATYGDLTPAEEAALAAMERAGRWEDGYAQEHATRPQTLGYGLTDSPAGLCAWIVEKFRAWTDCDGHPENALTRDEMLDDVSLYWLTRTAASSTRLYWESYREVEALLSEPGRSPVDVPTGSSMFPKELPWVSRRWAERRFRDIRFWSEPARGGHFAALEQPDLLVADLRAFFRLVR